MKFSIGDRVVITKVINQRFGLVPGAQGTVREYDVMNPESVGVEWDNYNKNLHNLAGSCKHGHGWWVDVSCISIFVAELGEFEGADISDITALLS